MASQSPNDLIGIHTNMAVAVPVEIDAAFNGAPAPPGLSVEEQAADSELEYAVFLPLHDAVINGEECRKGEFIEFDRDERVI